MAADDIYRIKMHFEAPTGHATSAVYAQETIGRSGVGTDTQVLARSFDAAMTPLIRAVLSDDWWFPCVEVEKVSGQATAKWREDLPATVGLAVGPSLPANNTHLFGLQQGLFPPRSNGKLYIPGVPEAGTVVGVMTSAHHTNNMIPLALALATELVEESAGAGRYDFGVISAKVRDLALPAKDWEGAFATIGAVSANIIVATQRRRQTQVHGQAL